jgi:anti-sigma B factor antagonist
MNIFLSGQILRVTDIAELNATLAPQLRDQVRAALKPDTQSVEIDLSDTKFVDSSGLGALIAIQKTLGARNGAVLIVNPTSTVVQILELTRLHRVLEIVRR